MPLSIEEAKELTELLKKPDLSPEVRAQYESLRNQQQAEADATTGVTEDSLDPNVNMHAQVHAVTPSATGEAAKDPQGAFENSQGKNLVIFYEPTQQWVQQKMADPAVRSALGYKANPTPEELAAAGPGDELYDLIANEEWRKAGSAADAAGKVGYRYKDHPWLQQGQGLERLNGFGTKLQAAMVPALESAASFLLGVDDTSSFKIGQNLASLTADNSPQKRTLPANVGDEYVRPGAFNSMTGEGANETQRQMQERLRAENPKTVLAGQVGGVAQPWGLTNRLANYVTSGIRSILPSAAGVPLALASGATTGVTMGAAQLATNTAAKSLEAGEYGPPTPEEVHSAAMEAPYGAAFGAAGEMVGQGANSIANSLRRGRFPGVPKGALGDLEKAGDLNISTRRGVEPTERGKEMVEEGFARRANPIDVSSEKLAPKMLETATAEQKALKAETHDYIKQFTATPEGRSKLPGQNYTQSVLKQLERHSTSTTEGGLRPNDSAGEELVQHFNKRVVDGVSTSPKEGAIELSPEQAEAWLAPVWQKRLLPEAPKSKPGEATFERNIRESDAAEAGKRLSEQLKARGVEKVYVTPQRRTALEAEDLMDDLDVWRNGKIVPGDVLTKLDEGLRADRVARSPEFDAGLKQLSERRTQLDTMTARTTGQGNEQRGQTELQTLQGLSSFGRQGRGGLPMDNAMRQLADKAGIRPELEAHGSLDPMLRLSEASEFRFRPGGGGRTGVLGMRPGLNLLDPVAIRSFPAARALGSEGTSPIRGGRAARATAINPPASLMGVDSTDALIRQQLQDEQENRK